jgi:hypothetical protein
MAAVSKGAKRTGWGWSWRNTGLLAANHSALVPHNAFKRPLALSWALLLLQMWSHLCRAMGGESFLSQTWQWFL